MKESFIIRKLRRCNKCDLKQKAKEKGYYFKVRQNMLILEIRKIEKEYGSAV